MCQHALSARLGVSFRISAFLLTVFLFAACLAPSAQAQSEFEPGYIVFPSDSTVADTVRGQIINADWIRTPSSITFRASESDTPASYDASEIEAFGVGGDRYESHDVIIDQRPTRMREASPTNLFDQKRVFLLKLAEGSLTLFSYRDRRAHFFIQTPDAIPSELTYYVSRTYRDGKEYRVVSRQYRDQLENVKTPECAQASTRNINYTLGDFLKFANACNGDAESGLAANAQRRSSYRFEHHAGLVFSVSAVTSRLLGPDITNVGPGIGVAYNAIVTSDAANPTLAFLVGLTLSRTSYAEALTSQIVDRGRQRFDQTRSLDVVLLGLSVGGQRRFLEGPVRPFVEAGLTFDYPLMHRAEGELVITTESGGGASPSTATLDFNGSNWSTLHFGGQIGVGVQWNDLSIRANVQQSVEQIKSDVSVSLLNIDELNDASGFAPRNRVVGVQVLYQF